MELAPIVKLRLVTLLINRHKSDRIFVQKSKGTDMRRSEEIVWFVDGAGGVASAAQIKGAGFLPGSISYALKSGVIDKLTRGVYCLPDVFDDEFTAVSYRWRKCVISHSSALYLAGLSDRMCYALDVTVPHGYNPRGLTREYLDARIHRVNPEVYELGITEVRSPCGAMVKAYSAERAVADLISQRSSEGADPQLVRDVVVGYFKRSDADLEGLARMCSALGVEDKFRMYLEVLR